MRNIVDGAATYTISYGTLKSGRDGLSLEFPNIAFVVTFSQNQFRKIGIFRLTKRYSLLHIHRYIILKEKSEFHFLNSNFTLYGTLR